MFPKALLVGALAALAAAQSSVLSFTRVPSPITAGQAQALIYATNSTNEPVTIILRKGASGNLDTVATLTDSATGGQYIWTPSDNLENGNDYALQITQGSQTNYFGPFPIQGASGSSSSSSSSASSSRSSSSATSASAYTTSTAGPLLNGTTTSSSRASYGTGLPTSRNSTNGTLTSATLTRTSSTTRPTASNTDDLNLGGTSTGADAPANTGAAAMLGSSAIALAFGAAAAVLMG